MVSLWITSKKFARKQGSRGRNPKDPRIRGTRSYLLRQETGRRPAARVRIAEPVRVELELPAAEVPDRGEPPRAIGAVVVLVTGAVDPQVVVVDQPLRVRQQHARDLVAAEAELVRREDEASAADGAASVALAELGSDDEDVRVALRFREASQELRRARRAAEAVGAELTGAVVVQRAVLRDRVDHALERLAVGRRELRGVRDGVPSLGPLGQLDRPVLDPREELLVREDAGAEVVVERPDLVREGLRLEALRVVVLRVEAFLLVGEGLDLEKLRELLLDHLRDLVAAVDRLLRPELARVQLLDGLRNRVAGDVLELADLGGGAFISLRCRGGAGSSHGVHLVPVSVRDQLFIAKLIS